MSRRTYLIGIGYGLATALLWGAWAPMSKLGVSGALDAWDLAALRYCVSGAILLPFLLRHPVRADGIAGLPWTVVLAVFFTAGVPYGLLMFIGFHHAPAGHQVLIGPAVGMLVRFLLARFVLRERIGAMELVGGGIILGGVMLAAGDALAGAAGLTVGHAIFLAGAFVWSAYVVLARAWRIESVLATAIISVVSALLYGPLYLWLRGFSIFATPPLELAGLALFHGVLQGVVSLILFQRCLLLIGVAQATIFTSAVPALATLLAWPLLGEVPTPLQLAGVTLVTLGMLAAVAGGLGPGRAAGTATGQAAGIVPGSKP